MKQHTLEDVDAARYATGLASVWHDWQPTLDGAEALLDDAAHGDVDHDAAATELRRVQYRAHLASELAAGLVPPLSIADVHEYLVAALVACRDTCGVLAIRADLVDLDEDGARVGLHAFESTRDAFGAAHQYSTASAHVLAHLAPPMILLTESPRSPRRRQAGTAAAWTLLGLTLVTFLTLAFELFLLAPAD